MRRTRGRAFALGTLTALLILLLLEGVLQLFSFGARTWLALRPVEAAGAETITLLCVGDSHTYGAALPREHSYPSQLEARLEALHPGRGFRVLNFGVPGVNSAFVANRLEQQILQHAPHMVLVWVGTNNRWNALETEAWGDAGAGRALHRVLLRAKLYRLARVLWFGTAGANHAPAVRDVAGFRLGDELALAKRRPKRLSDAELEPGLAFDMERMVATARSLGAPILFVTYPRWTQAGASRTLRMHAATLGVPVVDTAALFEQALAEGRREGELIVMAAGPHPTALLYAHVVEAMLPVVEAELRARGIRLGPESASR